MFQFIGDVAYLVTIVGVNAMVVFLLWLTKWRKDFVSGAITMFFGMVALILDLAATMLFFDGTRDFIRGTIRTPIYVLLAVSIWTLVFASFSSAKAGRKRREKEKVDVTPPQK